MKMLIPMISTIEMVIGTTALDNIESHHSGSVISGLGPYNSCISEEQTTSGIVSDSAKTLLEKIKYNNPPDNVDESDFILFIISYQPSPEISLLSIELLCSAVLFFLLLFKLLIV